jgi:hypothetical protein
MNKPEFGIVVWQQGLKPWRHSYFKLVYKCGHSTRLMQFLFRSFLLFSCLISTALTILIFSQW